MKKFVFKLGNFRSDFNPLVNYNEDAEVQLYVSSGKCPELVEDLHVCSASDNDEMTSYVMSVKTAPYAIRIVTETPL